MKWRTTLGILLVPVVLLAGWFLLSKIWYPRIAEEPFVHEGNLVKDNPGFEPGIWYFVYEEPGSPGLFMPLVFDHDSRCGVEGMLGTCDISFEQGERVRVEGVQQGSVVRVRMLSYVREPGEEGARIKLYFYDPKRDTDENRNILCGRQGLVAVEATAKQFPTVTRVRYEPEELFQP